MKNIDERVRAGVRPDGTVEGYLLETWYFPWEGLGVDGENETLVVSMDAPGYVAETRIPLEAVEAMIRKFRERQPLDPEGGA